MQQIRVSSKSASPLSQTRVTLPGGGPTRSDTSRRPSVLYKCGRVRASSSAMRQTSPLNASQSATLLNVSTLCASVNMRRSWPITPKRAIVR